MNMGLRIIHVEVGPGAETIITAEIPEEVRVELLEKKTEGRKPGLKEIMVEMVRRSEQSWGQVQRMKLSGGLGIDVICGIGKRRLQIWRVGKYPSKKEWETVLAAWVGASTRSQAPKVVEFKQFTNQGRWYLRGEWAIGCKTDERIGGMEDESKK